MFKKWLVLLVVVVLLPACGGGLFMMDDIMLLEKGASKKEVQSMVNLEPVLEKKITVSGSDYSFQRYNLKVGVEYKGEYDMNNKYKTKKIDVYDEYYFLFNADDKVIYWGLLSELIAADDKITAEAGRYIKANLKNWRNG